MINTIILGHALNILPKLPAESVNCVTTSPPYWSLRDYGIDPVIWGGDKDCKHEWGLPIAGAGKNDDKTAGKIQRGSIGSIGRDDRPDSNFCLKCNAWCGSLGLEPTFDLYIKHLCDIFDEVKRVLRKDGTCWVNLGDTYNSHSAKSKNVGGFEGKQMRNNQAYSDSKITLKKEGVPDKSLCDIPYRFSIEMTNRGWIKRNTIIWHKPNCMPSSADDRFTVDFEYLFFFVKNKNYWFEQQFEAWKDTNPNDTKRAGKYIQYGGKHKDSNDNKGVVVGNPKQGRNKRCVWIIPTQPFPEVHFAVYPEDLIEIPIKAGCPEFVCKKCGKARVRILDNSERLNTRPGLDTGNMKSGKDIDPNKELHKSDLSKYRQQIKYKELGYTDCGCGAGWESGIVCDPFMGAGTTALVALKQRKRFIGIEIKQEYIDMSYKRIAKVQQRIF